jgi:MinD superfamily P-loop ATPase
MKEIVVISGKGGTGKTSLTASFACLEGSGVVVADCDVDAADMHLLMQPEIREREDFYSGELAFINQDKCTDCGKCAEICRFDAIDIVDGRYIVDPLACEGCGYCARICTSGAISNEKLYSGEWYISRIKTGGMMVHARLGIGADNSGKLVAKVKKEARSRAGMNGNGLIIIDGPPGIGCPVISSITGSNFAVLVTEPTISGWHDLKRAHELVRKFNIRSGCIINKSDLNLRVTGHIMDFLGEEGILHIASLPYDKIFTESMTYGQAVTEYANNNLTSLIKESWDKIKQSL